MAAPSDYLVLLVDDEADILEYLSAALEDAGFRVVTASSGREALEAVKRERPAFISLDLVMPGGSGIGFLHQLRRNRDWASIPVMIVTGHARDELGKADLAKALDDKLLSGPNTYLEKPVRADSFVAAVLQTLGLATEAPPERAPVAGQGSVRAEISDLLDGVPPEKLEEVLRLLKSR